jgi:outer membrane protein assembly factor BamB
MHRGVLHFGAFLLALMACARAFAHGVPPQAYAVLSHDAQGPLAVSFSAGVALRRGPQQYQFLCPMAWNDQFASPIAALPDGTIVVGATDGLILLALDGTFRPHPDPAAIGRSDDVVRSPRGAVFSLRPAAQGSEVLAVDAQTVRVLWKDANILYSLAALDDRLVLLRANGMMLEQVTLSATDGAVLERQTAILDLPIDYVFARASGGTAYALVVFRNGSVRLGSLQMNNFTKLADGELSIAGPLSMPNGTLLALDGKLTQLVAGQAAPLADEHNVVCLAEQDGLTYACDSEGIARVNDRALAEPLFRFDWLVAPDLARVPEGDQRFLCNSQWQDLRFDIQLTNPDFGSMPVDPSAAGAAGAAQPVAGAGAQPAAAGGPAAGGGGPGVPPPEQVQQSSSGCAAVPASSVARAPYVFALALLFSVALSRSRRRRSRVAPQRPNLWVSR